MKQLLKFLLALGIALVIILLVRAFAFTVCSVPTNIGQKLVRGDRVLVNRIDNNRPFHRGELMVFNRQHRHWPSLTAEGDYVGEVKAVPGDTISVKGNRYVIPTVCCTRCGCPDCKLYLVDTGRSRTLVHRHQVEGSARRLFHLPW